MSGARILLLEMKSQHQMLTGYCQVCTYGLVTVLLTMHASFVISFNSTVLPVVWPKVICAQM